MMQVYANVGIHEMQGAAIGHNIHTLESECLHTNHVDNPCVQNVCTSALQGYKERQMCATQLLRQVRAQRGCKNWSHSGI